jgi:glycerol-3-phosphate cytidylyltransferase
MFAKMSEEKIIITFGTFDVFHVGHVNVLEKASMLGSRLIVGVSSDELNFSKKERYPVYPIDQRMKIVAALRVVDEVFVEESLELKRKYIMQYKADILVMGDDWEGKFNEMNDICKVIYLPRTPSISTTSIVEIIKLEL